MGSKLDELLTEIPDRFTINGQEYTVNMEEEIKLDSEPHLGLTHLHSIDSKIRLALTLGKDWPCSKGSVLNTYYHELMHVLLTHACIKDDEVKVQSLANIFMQYMMTKEYDDTSKIANWKEK